MRIFNIKNSKAVKIVRMNKSSKSDEIIEISSKNGRWIGDFIAYNKK